MKRSVQLRLVAGGFLLIAVLALVQSRRGPTKVDTGTSGTAADAVRDKKAESGQRATKSEGRKSRMAPNKETEAIGIDKFAALEMVNGLRVHSLQHLNRLSAQLGLTPEQETAFRDYFRSREEAASSSLDEAIGRGLMKDDETALRHVEELEAIVEKHDKSPKFDDLLRSTLTPEQYAGQVEIEKRERDAAAVKLAREQLKIAVKHVDLSAAERDRFHQEMCERELAGPAGKIDLLELMAGPGGLQMHKVSDLLDAGKAEVLMKAMAAENQRGEEMLRELLPAGR